MKKSFIFLGVRVEALIAFSALAKLKFVITVKNSYVHNYAKKNKINFFLININNKDKIFKKLTAAKSDIIFSAGFPYILDKKILDNFKFKLNSHPSLLPKYKGASPIKEAYSKKEKKFGVTLHHMIEKVDSGKIIYQDFIYKKKLNLKNIYKIIFSIIEPNVIIKGVQKIFK